ncbi:putative integral membrane protein (DUF2269) [Gaiella occulta]|uniref:Putative integral membrane protein (DUF2269) n=1 Tax=Gaiella occulta TaxID=1002870 RepID=A0A7M2YZU1_9ACTN|nr:DUF2269 family protein [Gaiella occulta]RDI75648.1 putative integral membrane protein (DUF2269) [Gaiella occulta]
MSERWLLLLHLAGAFLFVGGSIAAAILRVAAMRRSRPSEIALLLRAVRPAVPLVAGGLVLGIGSGFWLAHRLSVDLASAWLSATFASLGWIAVVGALAGRQDRRTRELAERLAADADARSGELERRLRDPLNLALNASLLLAIAGIVVLMVWQPGA